MDQRKYSKNKICLACFILDGVVKRVTDASKWCCVKHGKQVSVFRKANPEKTRLERGKVHVFPVSWDLMELLKWQ